MAGIKAIEGIGDAYGDKLKALGIRSKAALLKAGATKKGRVDLAARSGVSEKLILEWVNRADLYRVKGIGTQYADLLENAGVDTVVELAGRKAENLVEKMRQVNAEKRLVRLLPPISKVQAWIAEAKKLPRAVSY
jgi:predicted flap endonuclease-1-like 5' DNA nuclease